ncbi:MAG: hypothetical protein ACSW8I_03375 [bacterium]
MVKKCLSSACPLAVFWLISPIVLPLFSHRSPIYNGRTMGEQWENDGRNTLVDITKKGPD